MNIPINIETLQIDTDSQDQKISNFRSGLDFVYFIKMGSGL